MLDYLYGKDQAVALFCSQLIPHCRRGFGPNIATLGVIDLDEKRTRDGTEIYPKGTLIYGAVYHNWDPDAGIIEISGAAFPHVNWLTRDTLRRIYQYPFLQLDCQMIVQRVPADNERLLGILARYDYAFSLVPRLFGRDRDGVVCTLTREAWEANKFNRRLQHHIELPKLQEAA